MPRRNGPRSSLHSTRATQPEFGARHPITYTDRIDGFFAELFLALDEVVPTGVNVDRHGNERYKHQFRMYDDPKRVGVKVLERRLPRSYAQKQRVKWTQNDAGRIRGEIQNEIARLDLADTALEATFTNVVRLGDADESPNARKLGLILDQKSELSEFLAEEHAIVINGISGSLKRFHYPYDSFVPHWTVARIARMRGKEGTEGLVNAVGAIQDLLPITVQLEPIDLYSQQNL